MNLVSKCPKNLTEWSDASKRLGCGRDVFDKDQYMCTPNVEKTSLVEFCHKGVMGIKEEGTCTQVNKNASLHTWNCTEFKTGCPKTHYYNYEIYKYPACQDINPVKMCYTQDPSCTPINFTVNNDNIPKDDPKIAMTLPIVSVFVLVLGLLTGLMVWRRKKKQQKQKTKTQSLSNNNPEPTRNHDETIIQFSSDDNPEPTRNHNDFSREDQHCRGIYYPSRPIKPVILPKTNYQTRKMPFSLARVHMPIINKTHLLIPEEFTVKIRKTKRKDQEPISEESSVWKVVTSSKIQNYFFSESPKELHKIATTENIVPDEEDPYHLLETLKTETLTIQSLQVVPDDVAKYLLSDPNVKAFRNWYISHFKVPLNKTANENDITKKPDKLNQLFLGKNNLENKTFFESPNKEPDNYAHTDLHLKTSITGRRMFEVPLPNLKKRTKENSFTTSRIHRYENSSAEETYPLQPQDDKDSDNYDTTCTFDKSENREMYEELSDHQVVLNKIGTEYFKLNGIMWGSMFFVKGLGNKRNHDTVFIILSADGNLPNQKSSISLVCLPPQRAQQDQIDCVGIIYSTPVDKIHTRETSSEMENATSEAKISTDGKSSEICR